MNEQLYHVCAPVLVQAVQLTAGAALPSSSELRQRLMGLLERMVTEGRRAGVADADLAEARYALVAFVDEQVMRSDWQGRAEWMSHPLQLELYRENTAGENFFVRLRSLLRGGNRAVAVEVYYLCLALGFSGAYASGGEPGALDKFTRAAHDQLAKTLPDPKKISPHAKPKGSIQVAKAGWGPLLGIVAGGLLLILLVIVSLGWSASSELDDVLRDMERTDTGIVVRSP
jgi:type VI secretion system protein ImpK